MARPWGVRLVLLALGFAAALQLAAGAAADETAGVDVCPANSLFKTLPFLKAAKPDALAAVLGNGLSIDMSLITDFIKTTLVPLIGANVFFFALAVLLLIFFILWRLLRWCCVVCCCRGSCDIRRMKNDPAVLLFGTRMRINKACMFVFGLIAICFAVYGMATVEKDVTTGAFNVLTTISDYTGSVMGTLDNLLSTINSTTGIINGFQRIVTVTINVDAVIASLTAIGAFLDSVPQPAALLASATTLETRATLLLGTQLPALTTGLGAFTTATGPAWTAQFTTITNAGSAGTHELTDMQNLVKDVADRIAAMDWTNAAAPANAVGGADIIALQSNVTALQGSATPGSHWTGKLNTLKAAIVGAVGTGNPYATLRTYAAAVNATAVQVVATKTALAADMVSLSSGYTSAKSNITWLLAKLLEINQTVLELPGPMADAYTNLASTVANMDTVMAASNPATVAANLNTVSAPLVPLTPIEALITALDTAETALFAVYSAANTAAYVAWLTSTTAAVTLMEGTNPAGAGPLYDFAAAIAAYRTSAITFANLVTAKNAFTPTLYPLYDSTPAPHTGAFTSTAILQAVTGIAHAYSISAGAAGGPPAMPPAVSTGTSGATTYVNTASGATLPASLTGFKTNIALVQASFAALGAHPSDATLQPKAQLATIRDAALTSGSSVKAQITSTVASFSGSTQGIRSMVVDTLGSVRSSYQGMATTYDGYRYLGSMVLYGISILFVLLLLVTAWANYHFGTGFSTLWLLVITVLYFLLALLMALLISFLYLGCNQLEPLAVKLAPAQMTPLLKYYFYGDGESVTAVLKSSNLVDMDAVLAQVNASKADVVSGLSGNFTWKNESKALIGQINTTIDLALGNVTLLIQDAGRDRLFGVYSEVKGFICCSVPNMFSTMWTGLTFAGVFATAMIVATLFFLGRLDKLPRRDCCGCTCHTRSKYAGTVCAQHAGGGGADGGLPQYATQAGFEQPLGPYAAAAGGGYAAPHGAIAVAAPWGLPQQDGAVSVVVQRPGAGGHKHKAG